VKASLVWGVGPFRDGYTMTSHPSIYLEYWFITLRNGVGCLYSDAGKFLVAGEKLNKKYRR